MDLQECIKEMKNFHQTLMKYLDEGDQEEEYQNLIALIKKNQIREYRYRIKNFLYLLVNISNNYLIHDKLFSKIEHLILLFKEEIKQNFSNYEIFKIFKSSKRLLLFLLNEKMFIFDESIVQTIKKLKDMDKYYLYYFFPEVVSLTGIDMEIIRKNTNNKPELFKEMREKGGINHDNNDVKYLIQNDLIEEFIIYVNKTQISLNKKIEKTIFETNPLLKSKESSLIEYAAFFGASQIFKYLLLNHVILRETLWPYAIHGRNPEIVNILEENRIILNKQLFKECLIESIKCHYIETTNYLLNKYNIYEAEFSQLTDLIIKFHNYTFLPKVLANRFIFFNLCRYNYVQVVEILLKTARFDVNELIIIKDYPNDVFYRKMTSLHAAIVKDNIEIVKLLLAYSNADVNIKELISIIIFNMVSKYNIFTEFLFKKCFNCISI